MPLAIQQTIEAAPAEGATRPALIGRLQEAIRAIERTSPLPPSPLLDTPMNHGASDCSGAWTLGEPALDGLIGRAGLAVAGVHEIKPAVPGPVPSPVAGDTVGADGCDWMSASAAARRFALALAVRRLAVCDAARRTAPVLWCMSGHDAAEFGRPHGPGLSRLGLDPRRLIAVEPARAADALWVLDEALKSGALALVLGQLPAVDLTPARRLALSAAGTHTPCLLLTHPRAPAAAATSTRWRIAPAPGAPSRLDPRAPGAARFRVTLERCRGGAAASQSVSFLLEWCDAAFRFRLAADVADRASGARAPQRRWGEVAARRA